MFGLVLKLHRFHGEDEVATTKVFGNLIEGQLAEARGRPPVVLIIASEYF